jgi:phosphatidylinositol alpha 1,6-mannosyltransferase
MASGLPVVVSAAAGEVESRVHEGETGYIVAAESADALRAAMERLADAALRRRMGAAARRAVAERTPEAWAECFEEAVERIAALPRR